MEDSEYESYRKAMELNELNKLSDHNFSSNPFTRDCWASNPDKFFAAYGFGPVGRKMKYTIFNDMKLKIDSSFQQQFAVERRCRNQNTMKMEVLIGPPGSGKTRLLLELCNVLSKETNIGAFYLVTFSGSSGISEYDQMQATQFAERSVAMRIPYQAVILLNNKSQRLDFAKWLKEVEQEKLEEILEIRDAIRLVGGDPKENCVVAVDESNKIYDVQRRSGRKGRRPKNSINVFDQRTLLHNAEMWSRQSCFRKPGRYIAPGFRSSIAQQHLSGRAISLSTVRGSGRIPRIERLAALPRSQSFTFDSGWCATPHRSLH